MPFSANCPACGAPVVFKSSASFHGVCEFCRSTLVRHGGNLDNLGRMADLVEDASPLRLGTEGRYKGVHFAVIGRIQLHYAAGIWNEWHVLFDDMRGGWLSDAGGEYTISFLKPPGGALPEFSTLKPNQELKLAGRDFVVTDIEEAMCIAGEGELPFAFGAGYPAQLVDLRSAATAMGRPSPASTIRKRRRCSSSAKRCPSPASISPTCAAKRRRNRRARSRHCSARPAAARSRSTTRPCRAWPAPPA